MDTVIEEVARPHLVREGGRGGRVNRIPVYTVWEVVEGPTGTSSEVTVTFWTEPTVPLDRLKEALGAPRWFQRNWRRALVRLRDLAESDRPVERVVVAGADR
jgi:hypothetical protein